MDACIRFTKANIDALPLPPAGKRVTYHEKNTALQLRVTSNGAMSWSVFRRTKAGPPQRVTLGKYPEMTIEQARRQAAIIVQAIQAGGDPAAIRRAHREEMTFRELFEQYIERHAKPRKRTWKEDETKYKQYLAKPLGSKKLSMIGRREIAQVHSLVSASGHPTTANRVLALVSSVFGWAISAGSWDKLNPAKGIKRNREKSRDRFLQADELPHFFAALITEPLDTVRDYIWISLLTGARRANVLAMRWRDISFERAEWRIERTKNGEPQTVTLTPEAVEILRRRKPAEVAEYVFPGPGKAGHLTEPRKTWRRILARAHALGFVQAVAKAADWETDVIEQARSDAIADPRETLTRYAAHARALGVDAAAFELRDLRIHDLRRTLGSWQNKTGATAQIIGKSLNHKSILTTMIYARLDQDPVRQSVQRATSKMFEAAGLAPSAEVVPLPRRAHG